MVRASLPKVGQAALLVAAILAVAGSATMGTAFATGEAHVARVVVRDSPGQHAGHSVACTSFHIQATTWSRPLDAGAAFEGTTCLVSAAGPHPDVAVFKEGSGGSGEPVSDAASTYAVINIPTEVSPDSANGEDTEPNAHRYAGAPVSAWLAAGSGTAVCLGLAMLVAGRRRGQSG